MLTDFVVIFCAGVVFLTMIGALIACLTCEKVHQGVVLQKRWLSPTKTTTMVHSSSGIVPVVTTSADRHQLLLDDHGTQGWKTVDPVAYERAVIGSYYPPPPLP